MFLAGSKKIRGLLHLLVGLGLDVVLINTNPHLSNASDIRYSHIDVGAKGGIRMATLPRYGNTDYTYLKNLLEVKLLADGVVAACGRPDIVWTYNAHAIESRFAGHCRRQYGSRYILEFEDWHFARIRRFAVRQILDWLFWRVNLDAISYAFVVNTTLLQRLKKQGIEAELLPGIIGISIINKAQSRLPFQDEKRIVIGYFGGLSMEKGAGFLLELMRHAASRDERMRFVVTGVGELSEEYKRYGLKYPDVLNYQGLVDEERLAELMAETDVLVNPHDLNNGIFPFKLMEYVATGRVCISTVFDSDDHPGLEWMSAVCFCDRRVEAFYDAFVSSRRYYEEHNSEMRMYAKRIVDEYSFKALHDKLEKLLISNPNMSEL